MRWRCSVQLRGGLAALREVAPCLFARWVEVVRWQLHPRVQSLRLMALRCCCCCLDVDDSIARLTKCDRSVTIPFFRRARMGDRDTFPLPLAPILHTLCITLRYSKPAFTVEFEPYFCAWKPYTLSLIIHHLRPTIANFSRFIRSSTVLFWGCKPSPCTRLYKG